MQACSPGWSSQHINSSKGKGFHRDGTAHARRRSRCQGGGHVHVQEAVLALRRRCVQWLLSPTQRHLIAAERQICPTFGAFVAQQLTRRACGDTLIDRLRHEAGLAANEAIDATIALRMLDACPTLVRGRR